MSRTQHTFKGKKSPAKTRKKIKDVKDFGYTSGTHSRFEELKAFHKKEFEESTPADPWYELKKKAWESMKDINYPTKGVDYIKYGYGNGSKKKVKNYKKEIE